MTSGIKINTLLLLLFLLITVLDARAQALPAAFSIPLPGVESYSDAIPTPEEVIGHQVGTRHTEPYQFVAYFRAVANESNRVVVMDHGKTYEGRPLIHAIVTSPENHARLDAIRNQHLQLSDNPSSVSDEDLGTMPAIIWMGYSVHGNEASGSEASLLALYHLAAGQGTSVQEVLDNVVVILDPSLNPDGRNRFATWVNGNRGAVAVSDLQDREHNEPWPGGRTNHYLFDLNRDWLPLQHPESRGRLEVFHTWRPLVVTDHHEMGGNSTFFFQPGIPDRNNPITPEPVFDLTQRIAEFHARRFDSFGALYYANESFDDFYYGKGSTFPDVNGSVGILFEQASSRALLTETVNGEMDYAFTVRNQFSVSLSTMEAAVALREDLLQYHRDFYASVPEEAARNPVKAYVLGLHEDRTRTQALMQVMLQHRIELYALAQDYEGFSAGEAVVVPMNQPQHRLIRGMMERMTTFQDSLFYDVSSWTLPLAFGVPHTEVRSSPDALIGSSITEVSFDGGARMGNASVYAYVIPWGRYFAPRALYRFQQAGLYPRVIHQPFTGYVSGEPMRFERGSILIPVAQRDPALDVSPAQVEALVQMAVEEDHVEVYGLDSGYTPEGPDMGTPSASVLTKPVIAIVSGSGTSAYNVGQVWHLLSERFKMPVSLLDVDEMRGADLSRYTTIIMAGGFYGGLPTESLKEWVREGGHLIGTTSAFNWAVRNEVVSLTEKESSIDSLLQTLPYDALGKARGAQVIGGAIFEVALDTTHPVAYGFNDSVPVFRSGNSFFELSEIPGANVGRYADQPLLSGYISEEMLELMPASASIVAQRMGRGRVVLFADNPNFRAFWWGTNGLFMNAIFFAGAF